MSNMCNFLTCTEMCSIINKIIIEYSGRSVFDCEHLSIVRYEMKKRVFLLVLSIITAIFVSVMTSFAVLADEEQSASDTTATDTLVTDAVDTTTQNTPETDSEVSSGPQDSDSETTPETDEPEASPYAIEFLTETGTGTQKIYTMTKKGSSYYCTMKIKGGDLYPFVLKVNGAVAGENTEFILYKEHDGDVEFSYNSATGLSVKHGEGDAYDVYSYTNSPYKITIVGGKFDNLPGKFSSKNISMFFFNEGDMVSFSAIIDRDKKFGSWECEDEALKTVLADKNETVSFTLPALQNKDVEISAVLEMKALTLEQMLLEHGSITLEENYTIDKTITLTEGEYSIDLGGYTIKSRSSSVFKLDGATLTIEGEGEIIGGGTNYAVYMERGNLIIDGAKITGADGAVRASAGVVTILSGELVCGEQTALYIEDVCEVTVSGGTLGEKGASSPAVWLNGGNLVVNGGSFYGKPNTIRDWHESKSNIKVSAGKFESDVSKFLSEDSVGKQVDGMFVVSLREGSYIVTVVGGSGSGIYKAGDTVTLTLDKTDKTTPFKGWKVTEGELILEDSTSENISFVMPANDVTIKAEFEAAETTTPVTTEPVVTPDETVSSGIEGDVTTESVGNTKDSSSTGLIVCIIILVVLLIAAIAVAVILLIKKLKEIREEEEKAELGSSVVDDLADKLAMLDFSSMAVDKEEQENDASPEQPRIRRPRAVRSRPDFEPEDLTVTKEMGVSAEQKTSNDN